MRNGKAVYVELVTIDWIHARFSRSTRHGNEGIECRHPDIADFSPLDLFHDWLDV